MKNLELEHYGVQSLSCLEQIEIDGGKIDWGLIANICGVIAAAIAVIFAAKTVAEKC